MPFELGRPLGAPDEPEFQRDVLRSALALLEELGGPVIRDYPHDAPGPHGGSEGWACPLPTPPPGPAASPAEELHAQLDAEIRFLRPWYEESVRASGRTAVGLSGLPADAVEEMAAPLISLALGEEAAIPDAAGHGPPMLFRYFADDLKAFYFEAAAAQPRSRKPTPTELSRWLFDETVLGSVLHDARTTAVASDDRAMKLLGFFLVPQRFVRRKAQ